MNGDYYCSDDSYGLNPSIDFNSPLGGVYDIWVGSFSQSGGESSTLYITELSANHP